MFNGAKNVVFLGCSLVANAGSPPKSSLDKLFGEVALNAIDNAGGRAGDVRCYPGTRQEVIGRLEQFMNDESPGRKRMMWLKGPAGAGKSAICQSVAERRNKQGHQAANFFFFRGDGTRSHRKPLVATLVYQLRQFYPALDEPLSDCLETSPLICGASIETQFKQLISSPIRTIQQSTPIRDQIGIIIDGLDECNDKSDQEQILVALHALAHADQSPFLILVSSRAEPHLVMTFNRLGRSVQSIFLNDEYRPQEDIRLFVVAKFAEIKSDHHLAATLNKDWPPDAVIDAIINKSSGQFVYAAAVMRYIQLSSSSPALSLVAILEMPSVTNHNPLAFVDAVYSHIFSTVDNISAVKLILFARNCANEASFGDMLQLVGFKDIEVQSFFADLASIIKVVPDSRDPLVFYHASLEDYLNDKTRSQIYYVNENEVAAEFTSMCLRNVCDAYSIQLTVKPLKWVLKPTPEFSESLLDASRKRLTGERRVKYLGDLMGHVERLYWEQNKAQFKVLLLSWSCFVNMNNLDKFSRGKVKAQNPSASRYYEQYWMKKGYNEQELRTPSDSAPTTGKARSNTRINPSRPSAMGGPVHGLSVHRAEPPPQTTPVAPSNSSEGSSLITHRQLDGTSPAISPHGLYMIQVKLRYQGDTRIVTLPPDTPFSEFVDKVTSKFGKTSTDLILKFKDEDGDTITLCDDSDLEHAIEVTQESSKGKGKCKLEIWCEDSAR